MRRDTRIGHIRAFQTMNKVSKVKENTMILLRLSAGSCHVLSIFYFLFLHISEQKSYYTYVQYILKGHPLIFIHIGGDRQWCQAN